MLNKNKMIIQKTKGVNTAFLRVDCDNTILYFLTENTIIFKLSAKSS